MGTIINILICLFAIIGLLLKCFIFTVGFIVVGIAICGAIEQSIERNIEKKEGQS